jgi:hypothetical protein
MPHALCLHLSELKQSSVFSSEPDSREGERARDKEVCECLRLPAIASLLAQARWAGPSAVTPITTNDSGE